MSSSHPLRVAGLFAGIGGIELGLQASGHETTLFCEFDPSAQLVLRDRFPAVPLAPDVSKLEALPDVDLVTAGFPCQDLSQAGRTAGIEGNQSGLVDHVFRLLDQADPGPRWLLLENVSFMLSLDRGEAMRWLTSNLDERGYTWAYRVVDSRAFGLPQRRQRVLLLASREGDPRSVLLNQSESPDEPPDHQGELGCGFSWTEGLRGLGWAVDAVPTLKGGSALGIPSPPAIWEPGSESLVTPELRDAERLQGFPADWTEVVDEGQTRRRSDRWKLVGNAVSVPVAEWIGSRLGTEESYDESRNSDFRSSKWPKAAWGRAGEKHEVEVSMWPVNSPRPHLMDFLEYETRPLSRRATAGFLSRADRGTLRIPQDFLKEARIHLSNMTDQPTLLPI